MKDITAQSQNKITLVGKLLDTMFTSGKTSDGRPYERANATIRVTQTYNGKEETSEIPVVMFASQFTAKGSVNPAWQSIQDFKNLKTVQNVGYDDADVVRFNSTTIRENAFVTRQGNLVNSWQLVPSFVSTTKMSDAATFVIDIFIMDMHPEEDRDGDPTGRLIIKGGIVQYGGKLDVLEFVVEDAQKVDYVERNWNPNDTVTVKGRIRMVSAEEKKSGKQSSWGEDIPETTTRFIKELVITTGDDEAKEEEFAYDPSEIKKAFNVRKAHMEQLQVEAKTSTTKAPAQATSTSKYSWE